MANKRQLKKYIRYTCGDIAAEILTASHLYPSIDKKAVHAIVNDIATLQCDSLANTTFAFDKSRADFETAAAFRKAYSEYNRKAYGKLLENFNSEINKIIKAMNAVLPEDVRASFKALAQ